MIRLSHLLIILICLTATFPILAQVTGKVTDASDQSPIVGASIVVVGAQKGTTTNADGNFSLDAPVGSSISVSFIGYETKTLTAAATNTISLSSTATNLSEVVVAVGSRNSQRTLTDTPLPVDILSTKELTSTGQPTFDRALQYRVPSFNTVNTPVNDATTLLDPWEIRNMGPSRTLVLINGKRKNLSSLLYVQFSPGRGETGVDLSAIPQEAIKRVEILRDGASAQYGSDAIAGVMNVILKDRFEYSSLNVNTGITSKGDGGLVDVAFNSGANFGSKGYVNYTIDLSQQNSAVRSGTVDARTEIATFGGSSAADALITNYLKDYPTAGNINGTGAISAGKFLINAGIPLGDNHELYASAAMVTKRVMSYANFRPPYWRQDRGLLHSPTDNGGKNYLTQATLFYPTQDALSLYNGYIGYAPTFEGNLLDYNASIGARGENNGWKHDISLTTGYNQQVYTVENTVNRTLGKSSPTRFRPGGYAFGNLVGNIDISRQVTNKLGIAFGMEGRSETYTITAGDTASYSGEGANSFPGISANNAGTFQRFNIGGYFDLSYDVTKNFLVNGTVRTEKYSDFGNANVWKISSRYKLAEDKIVLRGSVSTGFRAPSLHQIYAQSTQASFIGGSIQLSGLLNNKSTQARLLGIPALKPERSTNVSLGVALNPTRNLSITLDYYNINVKDRIVYSSTISSSNPASALGQILNQAGVTSIQFFINGIQTTTAGLDYVVSYRNLPAGRGKVGLNLAGNFMLVNRIDGTPADPEAIRSAGSSILNTQIKSLLTESRPKYKSILGIDYAISKWTFNLNNTLFGPTYFQDLDNGGAIMENIRAAFKPAVVTDLSVGYTFGKNLSATANVNNLFNVLPKWDLVALNETGSQYLANAQQAADLRNYLSFNGRYSILGYNGAQFSQLGTTFNANIQLRF